MFSHFSRHLLTVNTEHRPNTRDILSIMAQQEIHLIQQHRGGQSKEDVEPPDRPGVFNLLKMPALPREKVVEPAIEAELRYFVPLSLFKEVTEGKKPLLIVQSYLPRTLIPDLLEHYEIHQWVNYADKFDVARIRAVQDPTGTSSYELEFKTPKFSSGNVRSSRHILPHPIPITASDFTTLQEHATDGTLVKRRYTVHGQIGPKKRATPCVAEVDEFIAGGIPHKKFETSFVTVDIELSQQQLIHRLISGQHTFDFLAKCVDMNIVNSKLCSPLSNRKIARNGLGDKQIKALQSLERIRLAAS